MPVYHSDKVIAEVGIMVDIETLGRGPRALVIQISLVGFDMKDPESLLDPPVSSYLPIDAQLELVQPRTITGDTIIWWMQQSDEARSRFANNASGDFEELPALMRHMIRSFNRMTNDTKIPYDVITRGPQFDIVILESLIKDCGLAVPWDYNRVVDLRTMMNSVGLSKSDVPEPSGFVKHDAYWDNRFQIDCYAEAVKRLGSR